MLPSPSFTNLQSFAVNEFHRIHVRALRNSWITRITGTDNSLRVFTGDHLRNLQNKRFTGVHDIRVDTIIGTVDRHMDFDKDFRPLKKHLRERWVNALLDLKRDVWEPIVVHKVGDFYYVEDGHHRVSVAQAVGMIFIEAEVWDHGCCQMHEERCLSAQRSKRAYQEAYCVNS